MGSRFTAYAQPLVTAPQPTRNASSQRGDTGSGGPGSSAPGRATSWLKTEVSMHNVRGLPRMAKNAAPTPKQLANNAPRTFGVSGIQHRFVVIEPAVATRATHPLELIVADGTSEKTSVPTFTTAWNERLVTFSTASTLVA